MTRRERFLETALVRVLKLAREGQAPGNAAKSRLERIESVADFALERRVDEYPAPSVQYVPVDVDLWEVGP